MPDYLEDPSNPIRIFHNGYGLGGLEVTTRFVVCPNQWNVSYCEYGDPDGFPVLYMHGWPGCRYEAGLVASGLAGLGIRLIAFDRPGYGLSQERPGRSLPQTVDLIQSFTQALQLDHFSILAISGGCPFALHLASQMPHHVRSIAIVGGLGPTSNSRLVQRMVPGNRILMGLARWTPGLAQSLLKFGRMTIPWSKPDLFPKLIKPIFPPADFDSLSAPEIYFGLNLVLRESFRSGIHGAYDDGRIFARGWSLPPLPSSIPIDLWHGKPDAVVPFAMSEFMHHHFSHSRFFPTEHDGHFSLPIRSASRILQNLVHPN
jgi:pimeloyl-ACP methyl ester carboxylesterase